MDYKICQPREYKFTKGAASQCPYWPQEQIIDSDECKKCCYNEGIIYRRGIIICSCPVIPFDDYKKFIEDWLNTKSSQEEYVKKILKEYIEYLEKNQKEPEPYTHS